ncbi:MAG: hypothetical protein ACLUOI_03975 [Eisenbergiella sp.]
MEEKKEKGNFWLTVATFIVNKRKAIYVLFFIAVIYSVASMNKVSVNQDITKYLPADSETNRGLSLMEEQFLTYGSAGYDFQYYIYQGRRTGGKCWKR